MSKKDQKLQKMKITKKVFLIFKPMYRAVLILALMVFTGISNPATASSGPDDLMVTGIFGFNGYYKSQTPCPFKITIENNGDQFDGWVSVDLGAWVPPTWYNSPVAVPTGTSRNVEIGCFGAFTPDTDEVTASLLQEDGEPLLRETFDMWMIQPTDSLVVHLGEPTGNLESLSEGPNPGPIVLMSGGTGMMSGFVTYPPKIYATVMEPSALPRNPILMQGVSLVTSNISTWLSMDSSIRDVIFEYVRHGGNILIYYQDGVDPIDGWDSDPVLHVTPTGETSWITYDQFLETCDTVIPDDEYWGTYSSGIFEFERDSRGDPVETPKIKPDGGEDSVSDDQENSVDAELVEVVKNQTWQHPDGYRVIKVDPQNPLDSLISEAIDAPLFSTRLVGGGRVGFAAFDPFTDSPTAVTDPVRLIAIHGLLYPINPSRELENDSVMSFRNLSEPQVRDFFSRGSLYGQGGVIRWLDALAPALIYLLGLPVLVIAAKGRGQMILVLFIIWSVIFTGYTLSRRSIPKSDKVAANSATLFWCEALGPDDEEFRETGATTVYSVIAYTSQTSVPHTVEFHHSPALLDEIVNPQLWPYENVTIEEGEIIRLPDLPVEYVTYSYSQERLFMLRRAAPEVHAIGQLTVGQDFAHLELDADLPFPALSSRLIVDSHGLIIGKGLGSLDQEFHLDLDLTEGEDITRRPGLFGDPESGEIEIYDFNRFSSVTEYEHNVPYPLRRFQDAIISGPVRQAQFNLTGIGLQRPLKAHLILTSNEIATDISIDHGDLEQHSLVVTVISIPIVYDEE